MSERITTFIEALKSHQEEVAISCLSPSFGVHDGLNAQEYVHHEVGEFIRRLLNHEVSSKIEIAATGNNHFEMIIISDEGLVYADVIRLDENGFIASNDLPLEVVAKFSRTARLEDRYPVDISRALAFRKPGGAIRSLIPRFPVRRHEVWTQADVGSHSYVRLTLHDEHERAFEGRFRVGFSHCQDNVDLMVKFPGTDTFARWQEKDFYPIVHENSVQIPRGKSRPWNLQVRTEDCELHVFERPAPGSVFTFEDWVTSANLTDALDNDWSVSNQ